MMQNKRARKSGRSGKTAIARASLESPQKRKVGVRTRRQAQLEDEEAVVVKQEDTDDVVKKEDDNAEDLDSDLPSIDDIINGRS
jgi:hypothetical protein